MAFGFAAGFTLALATGAGAEAGEGVAAARALCAAGAAFAGAGAAFATGASSKSSQKSSSSSSPQPAAGTSEAPPRSRELPTEVGVFAALLRLIPEPPAPPDGSVGWPDGAMEGGGTGGAVFGDAPLLAAGVLGVVTLSDFDVDIEPHDVLNREPTVLIAQEPQVPAAPAAVAAAGA